jgi:tripartite-type tricarboxylate transporter receptor subunit TctC
MDINRRTLLLGSAFAGLGTGLGVGPRADLAFAQNNRPISLVVGFAPGGSGDVFARIVAQGLTQEAGLTVIVENKAGAAGLIAADYVLRAKSDGNTLMLATGSMATTAPLSKKNPPFNPATDVGWIAYLSSAPFTIAINKDIPANDLKSFIEYVRARPGQLNYGHSGVGSTTHIASEAFKDELGLDIRPVPYRGSAPAISDLMGGQIAFVFETVGTLIPLHQADKVRALCVFDETRTPIAPDVPTAKEAAGVNLLAGTPNLLAAPLKTPKEIIDPLNAAINRYMSKEEIQNQLKAQGIKPIVDSTPASAQQYIAGEVARLRPLIKKLGLEFD